MDIKLRKLSNKQLNVLEVILSNGGNNCDSLGTGDCENCPLGKMSCFELGLVVKKINREKRTAIIKLEGE